MMISSVAEYEDWKSQTEESRRVVQNAIDAINRGDAAGFLGVFSDDFLFEMPGNTPVSGKRQGVEAFGALAGKVGERLKEPITIRVTLLLAAGEWVINRADGHAVTKDGKDYNNHYCHLWRVRNGKVVEFVEFNDTQLIMDVLFPQKDAAA